MSSISAGSIFVRSMIALMTCAARSSGRSDFSAPPYRPTGVRRAAIMAARRGMGRNDSDGRILARSALDARLQNLGRREAVIAHRRIERIEQRAARAMADLLGPLQ